MREHVHLLMDLGRESSVSKVLREMKSKSSAWLQEKLGKDFNWQGGYGVFSVSASHLKNVVHYIENQEEHHRHKTFQEEFEGMLKAAGVAYDPKYFLKDDDCTSPLRGFGMAVPSFTQGSTSFHPGLRAHHRSAVLGPIHFQCRRHAAALDLIGGVK